MFESSENVGKVQRFVGRSSQEEYKLAATVGQDNEQLANQGTSKMEMF
jgi:hypothetical protein